LDVLRLSSRCRFRACSFDEKKGSRPAAPSASAGTRDQQSTVQKGDNMSTTAGNARWATTAVLVGRFIFAAVFIMAVGFKLAGINATADYIAAAGFPVPMVLAWLAALLEVALIAAFLTGAYFSEAALVAAAYVLFLAFAFHGPSHWAANQAE